MKRIFPAALALAAFLASNAAQAADAPRTLRIATEGVYPPFSMRTPAGELTGFDVEIARALCAEMQAECEIVAQDWDGIVPGLLAGKYDAIVASMVVTEDRKRKVDFTQPYYVTPNRFMARAGTELEVTADWMRGKAIGVQRGTVHDAFMSDNFEGIAEIRRYGAQDDANADLAAGRLDAVLTDVFSAEEAFLNRPEGAGFAFVGPAMDDPRWFGAGNAIALRKGETELREALGAAISRIRENGVYAKINARYFPYDVWGR